MDGVLTMRTTLLLLVAGALLPVAGCTRTTVVDRDKPVITERERVIERQPTTVIERHPTTVIERHDHDPDVIITPR
jgi:hypothetical protein